MNKKVFKTLEFHKITDMLTEQATSDSGKRKAHFLEPVFDIEKIEQMQTETADALTRVLTIGAPTFYGLSDITEYEKRLESEAALSSADLLAIAKNISLALSAIKYNADRKDSDSLDTYFEQLSDLSSIHKEITRCIISEGEFANDASPALYDLRRKKSSCEEKIRSTMQKQLTSLSEYLQDALVTTRSGRYCLSVKSEHKSKVPGMVHDKSSSGQTLFIEPMAVVNYNNQIREIELAEEEELAKILATLSAMCAEHLDEMKSDIEIMTALDFIFAKGRLAEAQNATRPVFNDRGIIKLKKARHPLLDASSVVPIDINLGDEFDMLVITGPNTGGKTVSLKTCGLLTLMGQSGLHIPTADKSELAIFENVYADIGDEQSIEQSLSTFSSHMTNIIRILDGVQSCRENSHDALVLFDELCAGTDPTEGAALARAILNHLLTDGVKTMASTHYSELKLYALSTDRVENASLEFSVETLSPTYHLMYGIPGKSNAFAISKKLGLKDAIIEDARANIDSDNKSFEDIIVDLETKRIQIERDSYEITQEKKRIETEGRELDRKLADISQKRDSILQEANLCAANILKEAKDEADATIREIRKNAKGADMTKLEQTRTSIGKKVSKAQSKASINAEKKENNNVPKNLRIGDAVKVLSMNMKGTVHTLPNERGDLTVQMGIMQSKVNISDLVLIEEKDALAEKYGYANRKAKNPYSKGKKATSSAGINKSATVSYEIKLLGMTGDEAVAALEKYLDDAYLSHLPSVRVVHGKGTGALRSRVHSYLKGHPLVADYHLAEFGEGDAGVTIVEFK